MPVILFEGPDNSGKTTFARAVYENLAQVVDGVHYERSPVKELGWQPGHSTYLKDVSDATQYLRIQDRTPEISESVYGIMRGEPRGRGYLFEAYAWVHQPIYMVFCEGGDLGQRTHKDTLGNDIGLSEHTLACMLYEEVYFQLRNFMLFTHTHDLRVVKYDRWSKGSWLHTMWGIRHWLGSLFPEQAAEIGKALAFSIDSAFPMPSEIE